MEMLQEAGYAVWLVLAAGAVSTVLGARFAVRARREDLSLVVACLGVTLLVGCLGTAVGVQTSAAGLRDAAGDERWIFLLGLREALHNIVLALGFALVSTIGLAIGLARSRRARESVRVTAAEPVSRP